MFDGKSLAAGIDVSLPFSTGDFAPNHLLTQLDLEAASESCRKFKGQGKAQQPFLCAEGFDELQLF